MAYATGSANSAASLIAVLQTTCVANGWTLTNDILSKGTIFVRVWSPSTGLVAVVGGTGQSGGVLTGQAGIGSNVIGNGIGGIPFTYPMDYYIHVLTDPDEVYLIVNYGAGAAFQRLMFGKSDVAGLAGSGTFFDATNSNASVNLDVRGREGIGSVNIKYLPFSNYPGFLVDGGVHHDLTGVGAWGGGRGTWANWNIYMNSPSTWNGEAVLIPFLVVISMSGFYAVVLEPKHSRYVSIDNLNPHQVLTLGTDKWKVYPAFKKGPNRVTESSMLDTGQIGIAVRYDGP